MMCPVRYMLILVMVKADNKEVVRYMSEVLKERGWKDGQDFKYQLEHCSHREPYGVTHSERVWTRKGDHWTKIYLTSF